MKKRNYKKGFTLVELIVVLVILAILAAIMVPALLGWIDKARNQDAILECRNVVQAAQGQVAEEYAKGPKEGMSVVMNRSETKQAILDLAAVGGKIGSFIKLDSQNLVTRLLFTTSKDIKVLYDRSQNPVYQIQEMGVYSSGVPGYFEQAEDIDDSKKAPDYFYTIDEKGNKKIKEEYIKYFSSATNISELEKNPTKRLQLAYLEKYGEFAPVDWKEIKLPEKLGNTGGLPKEAVWKPILASNGEMILVVDKGIGQVGQSNTSIVYYNGEYYYHNQFSSNPGSISEGYVSDKEFSIENTLLNANEWTKFQ